MRVVVVQDCYTRSSSNFDNSEHSLHEGPARESGRATVDCPAGTTATDEGRIAAMDQCGIDVQILSHSRSELQDLEPRSAALLAQQSNDAVAIATQEHPNRLRGFAILPVEDPAAAVAELERCINDLNFVGALIHCPSGNHYIDDKKFWPLFAAATRLHSPVYLLPRVSPKCSMESNHKESSPILATNCLRLILGGVFDRFPGLQIIVGNQFEALNWMARRVGSTFRAPSETGLKKNIPDYLRTNFYGCLVAEDHFSQRADCRDVTWSLKYSAYLSMVSLIGIDRVLLSSDLSITALKTTIKFIEQLPISAEDKEKIAHINAEELLSIK